MLDFLTYNREYYDFKRVYTSLHEKSNELVNESGDWKSPYVHFRYYLYFIILKILDFFYL